jgi:hypothetical protein
MGYTTDFIGQIDIDPPLNQAEQNYLRAFTASRRHDRAGGPYEVPGNPAAEHDETPADIDAYNRTVKGVPSLWCQWTPCWDGCCISWDGHEKFYAATEWLTYLIDHFLAPRAYAQATNLPQFKDFTFNHVLDGIVAASRRDTGELYLISVECNTVCKETLVDPDPRYSEYGPLAYQTEIDSTRRRRRRVRTVGQA